MDSATTNSSAKRRLNISTVGPRFGSTKLAAAAIRGALKLAMVCALLLIAARPARAQTETVLHYFTGSPDGSYPYSNLTFDGAGNLYGTTYLGGLGYGTVYEVSPNGVGGWNETVLYSFTGGADGAYPNYSNVIFDSVGNLYGTTYNGGAIGAGVVFELSPVGTSWTETVLYNFCSQEGCADGGTPASGLIMDPAGNLYGTTLCCGKYQDGVVFELIPSGGGWTEQVIYNIDTLNYYFLYNPGLTMDAAGNIFGATVSTVFELSPNGNGGWTPNVIHTFTGSPKDGNIAMGTPVLDKAGNLYGTTWAGGKDNLGTVYKLRPGKKGKWTETFLHTFKGGKDGYAPSAGIVFDAVGNIYGTTEFGGRSDSGTVYELVAQVGKGSYKEKILWSFFYCYGGCTPMSSLILDSAGNLYGTAMGPEGWPNPEGVVFEVTP